LIGEFKIEGIEVVASDKKLTEVGRMAEEQRSRLGVEGRDKRMSGAFFYDMPQRMKTRMGGGN
jgi:hypothetical protein